MRRSKCDSGATTVVDAGSVGATTFPAFRDQVAYLNERVVKVVDAIVERGLPAEFGAHLRTGGARRD